MLYKKLTSGIGVALQIHYSSRLLLLLNRPSQGGFGAYLQQRGLVAKYVNNICGIAMTLTDDASSVLSSQCLYIGMTRVFDMILPLMCILAGMCVQDSRQRIEILALVDTCRKRAGWPIQPLGDELQAFWEATDNGRHG